MVDLTQYPAPQVVVPVDYEAALAMIKTVFVAEFPVDPTVAAQMGTPSRAEMMALVEVEGNLITKQLQAYAYDSARLFARVNDAARSVLLPYAAGTDLDNLAAFYMVVRREGETDDELRQRMLLAIDGFSTAGPRAAYRFHALTADSNVKDVFVYSPAPGVVRVAVLSKDGDGTATPELVEAVRAALNAERVRPLTDTVEVIAAEIVPFTVQATLFFYPGANVQTAMSAATLAVQAYADAIHAVGNDVALSGLYQALHQPGVQRVQIVSPATDLTMADSQAPWLTSIALSNGGTNA
jgi:phage-related baseplate assembly protein